MKFYFISIRRRYEPTVGQLPKSTAFQLSIGLKTKLQLNFHRLDDFSISSFNFHSSCYLFYTYQFMKIFVEYYDFSHTCNHWLTLFCLAAQQCFPPLGCKLSLPLFGRKLLLAEDEAVNASSGILPSSTPTGIKQFLTVENE